MLLIHYTPLALNIMNITAFINVAALRCVLIDGGHPLAHEDSDSGLLIVCEFCFGVFL